MRITGLIALLFFSVSALAQTPDWSGAVYRIGYKYPGYVVQNSGDTLSGYLLHGSNGGNQKRCEFFTNETDSKPTKVYKPDELKEYLVGDKHYKSIHYSGGLTAKPLMFVLVVKEGAITEFYWYNEEPGVRPPDQKYDIVYHKIHQPESKVVGNDKFIFGFGKNMSEFIADYPELAEKVKNKEKGYNLLDINKIMDEYNAWYAAKTN